MKQAYSAAPPLEPLRLPKLGTRGVLALIVIPIVLILIGLYAYAQQRIHGDVVTNMRSVGSGGAAWGLYIMFDIYFVGLAATGIAVATAVHLFRIREVRPLSRIAEFLALLSLSLAGMCVMADQGRPMAALLNLPRYARTMSPFFGSFTLIVGVGMAASLVMLYLGGRGDAAWCARSGGPLRLFYWAWATGYRGSDHELRRHRRARFWLSITIFPFIVVAYSTLGFVFGTQGGRPGWFGALRAPSMLVGAGISGIGILLLIAGLLHRYLGAHNVIPARAFTRLGNTMLVMIFVFLYLLAVEILTDRYAGHEAALRVSTAVLFGPYAVAFWIMVVLFLASFAIVAVQFLKRKPLIGWSAFAGLLVNVAVLLRRFLVVVPAQTHGHNLDYSSGLYYPSWIEISVVLGVISIGVLAFTAFMRLFPIVPLHAYYGRMRTTQEPESRKRSSLRRALTTATLVSGVALAVVGLAMSSRIGTVTFPDPLVPYSPVIFIAGVVMTIYSAAVYVIAPPG